MLEEVLEHMGDCRGPARRHALLGAPAVDFLDQPGLDPNVDICCFPFHAFFCAVLAFFVKAELVGSGLPRRGFMRRTRSDFGSSVAWTRRRRAVLALISLSSLALDPDYRRGGGALSGGPLDKSRQTIDSSSDQPDR
jgi:hypothetical protein